MVDHRIRSGIDDQYDLLEVFGREQLLSIRRPVCQRPMEDLQSPTRTCFAGVSTRSSMTSWPTSATDSTISRQCGLIDLNQNAVQQHHSGRSTSATATAATISELIPATAASSPTKATRTTIGRNDSVNVYNRRSEANRCASSPTVTTATTILGIGIPIVASACSSTAATTSSEARDAKIMS